MSEVSPIPEDFHTITPHLVVRSTKEAVDFYREAFGAEELYRNLAPDGVSIIHSEVLLGDSRFFIHDEFPDYGKLSPLSLNGSPVTLHLYVADVDEVWQRATSAGAETVLALENMFWGDRYGILKDPFGHLWSLASRLEDPDPEELQRRAENFFQPHD